MALGDGDADGNTAQLADQFILYGSGKVHEIVLFPDQLQYWPCGKCDKRKAILLDDVVGAQCMRGRTSSDSMAYLTLYTYPRQKSLSGNVKQSRKRNVVVFLISKSQIFTENLDVASLWKSTIKKLMRSSGSREHFNGVWKVLINPAGGQGKALRIFKEQIAVILDEAEIPHEIVVTERAGHLTEIIGKLDLNKISALVIVSGDGLIHEAINGLMRRKDWQKAIKTPLGIIPGGSGNALAASILEASGESFTRDFAENAALVLPQSVSVPLDLIYFDSITEQRYGFLSFGWGLLADIDIESEKFRRLGETRFTVGALQRIADLRIYSGKLSYCPVEEIGDFDRETFSVGANGDLEPNLLPSITDPIPGNWKFIDGDFIVVYVVSMSRISSSSFGVPWAKLSDGLLYLFWMKADAPKSAVLSFLLGLGTGDHLKSPHVQLAAVRAFRVEPKEKDGIMTVDGERIQYGPVQGQVLPSLGRVLSRPMKHSPPS